MHIIAGVSVTGLHYLVYFPEGGRHFEFCSSQILRGILSAHTHTHQPESRRFYFHSDLFYLSIFFALWAILFPLPHILQS